MPTSRSSRLLAPLALAGCILAVALVAMNTLGDDATTQRSASATRESGATTSTSARTAKTRRSTYTVKAGDSLSIIAEKTGVSVEELVALNPGVDPQSLRTGQKLKLQES
jgi:LysM repeat protein